MKRERLIEEITEAADALRTAISQDYRAKLSLDSAETRRRAADEAVFAAFETPEAMKAYGSNEATRKARLKADNAAEYEAEQAATRHAEVCVVDSQIARVNFEEACALSRLIAGVAV